MEQPPPAFFVLPWIFGGLLFAIGAAAG